MHRHACGTRSPYYNDHGPSLLYLAISMFSHYCFIQHHYLNIMKKFESRWLSNIPIAEDWFDNSPNSTPRCNFQERERGLSHTMNVLPSRPSNITTWPLYVCNQFLSYDLNMTDSRSLKSTPMSNQLKTIISKNHTIPRLFWNLDEWEVLGSYVIKSPSLHSWVLMHMNKGWW